MDADRRRNGVDGGVCRRKAQHAEAGEPLGHSRSAGYRNQSQKASSSARPLHFSICESIAIIAAELPLLAKAASWIGSIANQSRATLGGNLVNGSPAADSSPALLAYDAEIEMISVRGSRRIPYSEFHTGYKQNVLAADELLYAIHLPRRFARHKQYLRKVGTRRAMAIAKVALGATALLEKGVIREIRLGAASLAPFPMRLLQTEAALLARRSRVRRCKRRGRRCSPK